MQTIHVTGTTGANGVLTLSVPLGRPDAAFDVVVVIQPKASGTATPGNPWAAADAIRERLAATGRDFGDSVEDLRELRAR